MNKMTLRKTDFQTDLIEPTAEEVAMTQLVQSIRTAAKDAKRIVFVNGHFNILHSGHLRFLNFSASCGDFLVVALNQDIPGKVVIPEESRLAAIKAVEDVDYAFIMRDSTEAFLKMLKPEFVVKGREFSDIDNPEKEILESYGGKLLFGSGEIKFSDISLLKKEFSEIRFTSIEKPQDFLERHHFDARSLINIVNSFSKLNVVVVGDLIVDEYIICDPIGMSQEDPTIVVRPIRKDCFVGAAGIVAAHACTMGANVTFFTATNGDAVSQFAEHKLKDYGVTSHVLIDESRQTTVKQRYQAAQKTLLRINQLRDHELEEALIIKQFDKIQAAIDKADLLIFSDFNYGVLPQGLVDRITEYCKKRNVMMVADSQSSSQVGDISRFKEMNLVTPTEREARIAMQDYKSGIVNLVDNLMQKSKAEHVILTLGAEGVLICNQWVESDGSRLRTDSLKAFNTLPRDVSGAGDSLLAAASMTLAVGGNIWQAAYMGSVAAACQVSRVGNTPITTEELLTELTA